jgi:hypothetical protein
VTIQPLFLTPSAIPPPFDGELLVAPNEILPVMPDKGSRQMPACPASHGVSITESVSCLGVLLSNIHAKLGGSFFHDDIIL